jgi:hypothetical protein
MSKESAQNYITEWSNVIKDSENSDAVEEYLSNVDWSNMSSAIEAMDYLQSQGVDETKIKAFWDAATKGANTYVTSLAQALQLTQRIQEKMANLDNLGNRFVEGTASWEDVMEMVKAGVDVSKFKLTDKGWQASEADVAIGKEKLA